jgi:hypothetical protein
MLHAVRCTLSVAWQIFSTSDFIFPSESRTKREVVGTLHYGVLICICAGSCLWIAFFAIEVSALSNMPCHAMPCHVGPVPCRASAMSGQCHVGPVQHALASLRAATLDVSAGGLAISGAARSEPMGYGRHVG